MRKLKSLYYKLKEHNFIKSVLTLSSGIVFAQAINFIGMPIIGRVYTPDAIGDYTLITSSAAIINSIVTLGMMTSFMLPNEHEKARGLSRLVTGATIILSTIIGVLLYICSGWFKLFSTESVSYAGSLLTLWAYVVFYVISNICYAYVNRMKKYKVLFWNPIIGAGVNIVLGIIFGKLGLGFIGYTLSHIISFIVNIVHLIWNDNPYQKIENPKNRAIPMLKEYIRFPKYQMPANIITTFANQSPVYILENAFSPAALGGYSMCMKIMNLPAALLAVPVNRTYFREASERYSKGENIAEFTFKIMETNVKLAIVPISILMIFGEQIFKIFLGNEWGMAGQMAAMIGMYQLLYFCSQCTSGDFTIIGKNSWNLISSFFILLIQGILFVLFVFVINTSVYTFLFVMALLLTIRLIIAQIVFFIYLKMNMKYYFKFLIKFIVLPYAICSMINIII